MVHIILYDSEGGEQLEHDTENTNLFGLALELIEAGAYERGKFYFTDGTNTLPLTRKMYDNESFTIKHCPTPWTINFSLPEFEDISLQYTPDTTIEHIQKELSEALQDIYPNVTPNDIILQFGDYVCKSQDVLENIHITDTSSLTISIVSGIQLQIQTTYLPHPIPVTAGVKSTFGEITNKVGAVLQIPQFQAVLYTPDNQVIDNDVTLEQYIKDHPHLSPPYNLRIDITQLGGRI